jgi:hypothetical protein
MHLGLGQLLGTSLEDFPGPRMFPPEPSLNRQEAVGEDGRSDQLARFIDAGQGWGMAGTYT